MKVIAINNNVYRIKDTDYTELFKRAEDYIRSMDSANPNSEPYMQLIDDIESRYKPIVSLDNAIRT